MKNSKQYSIVKYLTGGCWIITGILGYCNNNVMEVIRIALPLILLLIALICPIGIKSIQLEQEEASIMKAKAFSATVIYYVFCASAVLAPVVYLLFDGKDWNWMLIMTYTFFLMMGIVDISTGIIFSRFTKRSIEKHMCFCANVGRMN